MQKLCLLFFIVFIIYPVYLSAQEKDYQIGLDPNSFRQSTGGYYDYSDPNGINIKVAVWGYVKYPGRYVIPIRSDIKDLISYSGGINDNAFLDNLRIYRLDKDSTQLLLKIDFEDLWWGENWKPNIDLSKMHAGDVLIVPGRPRVYWENYLSLILSSLGFLISVATLVITASK
ncbi:MAG: SLBB domain-containing protein [Bacteroidetes bacterium]|nr:SLBB domain-containing protein [Bacteroidota bacterium]